MSAIPVPKAERNGYPTSDGKPMAETDLHRDLMFELIATLTGYFAGRQVYTSGNLLVFYEPGNRRRHVSPDVFVVRGVEHRFRDNYLIWEEGRGPEAVIELTSSSTRHEDTDRKMRLYRDTLRVREYFLFDPRGDHLTPRLQGYRLRSGQYAAIRPQAGRLPSQVIGLHLETVGDRVRLWDPQTQAWRQPAAEARAQQAEAVVEALSQQLAAAQAQIAALLGNGHPPNGGPPHDA